MKLKTSIVLIFSLLAVLPLSLWAEVTNMNDGGFTSVNTAEVSATPVEVYAAIENIGDWWNPSHGYTGDAGNFYFDARIGGCFCEKLPNGGNVEHLRIIYLAPGDEVRFEGALGPLQGMPTSGRMIWKIAPTQSGSTITFTFHVFGFMEGGFEGLAPAVDGVVGEQLQRLAALLGS